MASLAEDFDHLTAALATQLQVLHLCQFASKIRHNLRQLESL